MDAGRDSCESNCNPLTRRMKIVNRAMYRYPKFCANLISSNKAGQKLCVSICLADFVKENKGGW